MRSGLTAAGVLFALSVGLASPAAAQATKVSPAQIKEHMEVKGSDGAHVGTVDKVKGDRIELTKNDPSAGGVHHELPLASVSAVAGDAVTLSMTASDAKRSWKEVAQPKGDAPK